MTVVGSFGSRAELREYNKLELPEIIVEGPPWGPFAYSGTLEGYYKKLYPGCSEEFYRAMRFMDGR